MQGRRITKRLVDGLEAKSTDYFAWDDDLKGFGLRVQKSGAKSYVLKYRVGTGRAAPTRRVTIATVGKVTPDEARAVAKKLLGSVAHGADPAAVRRKEKGAAENTFKSIAENYLAREGGGLRTVEDRRAVFERLVYPKLGARQIDDIKRSDINKLLDRIEDERGPRMATLTLAYVRRVMNWHASRADDFRSPIVKGMGRGAARKRERVLTDDELVAFWRASAGWDHPYSHMLRFILLTATRRDEPAGMALAETAGNVWTLPAERYKTDIDFEVPLSRAALDVLAKVTLIGSKGLVFTTSGDTPISGFSKFKAQFDLLMLSALRKIAVERDDQTLVAFVSKVEALVEQVRKARGTERKQLQAGLKAIWWTIHDLRRTARSLMPRAGVDPDTAERCLGHVIPGVRGVYDRHEYRDEKAHAFEALAALIERIVNPQPNVLPMRGKAAG